MVLAFAFTRGKQSHRETNCRWKHLQTLVCSRNRSRTPAS